MNHNENYGWICPKCGCPNAPTNKTCVACFSPEIMVPIPIDKLSPFKINNPKENFENRPKHCPVCGLDLTQPSGYVCSNPNCPTPVVSCSLGE